jgi:hypothetical protein
MRRRSVKRLVISEETEELMVSLAFARRELQIARLEMDSAHQDLREALGAPKPRDGGRH